MRYPISTFQFGVIASLVLVAQVVCAQQHSTSLEQIGIQLDQRAISFWEHFGVVQCHAESGGSQPIVPFPEIATIFESSDVCPCSSVKKAPLCDDGVMNQSACKDLEFGRWSTTEIQFQYGELNAPSFAGGGSSATRILTLQHASGWKYGDNFFFVDILDDSLLDGFNDRDVYLEAYANFSLGKILNHEIDFGLVSDVGFVVGINFAADPDLRKWLPGIRLSWDLPGFAFFNTDFTAFIDDSLGAVGGGAPAETNSFMVDFNFAFPFSLGIHDFSIEGHVEFIDSRKNEFGDDIKWWILGQPQFRYDLGKTVFDSAGRLFVGIEWQIWPNKLGDRITDENELQFLGVWRL